MASKKSPSDREILALLRTDAKKLPKNQLHAKRIKILEAALIGLAKEYRDVLDDGVAKSHVLAEVAKLRRAVNKAVCHPTAHPLIGTRQAAKMEPGAALDSALDVPLKPEEPPPATVATDPLPAGLPPYPSTAAYVEPTAPPEEKAVHDLLTPPQSDVPAVPPDAL